MITINGRNFRAAYDILKADFRSAPLVTTETWQGVDASRPDMATRELEDVVLEFPIGTTDLEYHRFQIGPNLPWADDHFERDRVSGQPLNPGRTWADWPYALKANGFREVRKFTEPQFNHTYAERYWPKLAGMTDRGELAGQEIGEVRRGIRYDYGDLADVINLLVAQPNTRAAYLPVFFPEDTGVAHGARVPCTLGYLFRQRRGKLSVAYYIRSCDFVRHFQDDVYLTVRLLLWVLDRCRYRDARWSDVEPGAFMMHVGSMHVFVNDHRKLFG